ncbi:unnamed protein product [Nezara viridula]|uniref:Uncharacterized protein n=2 Tax=Nezara viridula TaxID=85310 RepID=A0A9P0MWX3_NEZVI|nr:unnamed protein product [Nezara viridula]
MVFLSYDRLDERRTRFNLFCSKKKELEQGEEECMQKMKKEDLHKMAAGTSSGREGGYIIQLARSLALLQLYITLEL